MLNGLNLSEIKVEQRYRNVRGVLRGRGLIKLLD